MALEFEKGTKAYEINEALREVIDPELNVNIVDLGLIYGILVEEDEKLISIDVTLSAPGCPLGDVILNNVLQTTKRNFPGYEVTVNLVWEPQWNPSMVTDEGKRLLNLM